MEKYLSDETFKLESGAVLPGLEIAYHRYGDFLPGKPVVWVCHALTASSDVYAWWPGLFGLDDLFNPAEYSVVCANVLGGCYGTTGPLSLDPRTGYPWYHSFPSITIRDMVEAHQKLADHLGIHHIDLLIGGSLGGQQALEWAIAAPSRISRLVLIATNARHSAWGIAFNETQRMAIEADPTWAQGSPDAGLHGMKTARAIALLSYRSYEAYQVSQVGNEHEWPREFRASGYQRYQGEKLARRFNAFSYHILSKAMDSHHVGRNRQSLCKALQAIKAQTLVVGITSDQLFPLEEQRALAEHIPDASLVTIESAYGHDGFLVETNQLAALIKPFTFSPLSTYRSTSNHDN
ncbi:MAG TPA: homoserine O-acetyltransferase [Saprospirales bacterium]|nr:homoserine O-acetyltransferase [Saprospirales bacterium]